MPNFACQHEANYLCSRVNAYGFEPRRLRFLIFIGKTTPKRQFATRFPDKFLTKPR
jgi:hypothetical protein